MSVINMSIINIAICAAILAVLYGAIMSKWIVSLPSGNTKMKEIAGQFKKEPQHYLARQYKNNQFSWGNFGYSYLLLY